MSDLVSNRKAYHHYDILETQEAGIVLVGTEIKSIREHGANLQDGYVIFNQFEAYLKNSSIAPYRFGNFFNHVERRERKLLLHKRELLRLKSLSDKKGFAIIPLAFYLKKGRVKVRLGIARGKKIYDKRAAIRAREDKRAVARSMKNQEV